MEFMLGGFTGFVLGFGLLYIQYHKSEISISISLMKNDIRSINDKLEKLISLPRV